MDVSADKQRINRRMFLKITGWGSFFVTIGIFIAGTVRFLFPRVLFEQPPTFKIGFPKDFLPAVPDMRQGTLRVYEQWKKDHSVWIVREGNRLYAIYAKCTHLGCTPNWFADERIFKCPCHGSRFYSNGVNFAGPAPRPLDRFRIFLASDGRITVDKSRIYRFRDFDKQGAYLYLEV
ncbi:MAG: Rieske 2Fe-2S domain-containing protein [Deferribacteres bacterium]|nr:Rieske 2Fe-2S domain-containing protein [Deferribacteres bacterium]